jgi:hypothetical protein
MLRRYRTAGRIPSQLPLAEKGRNAVSDRAGLAHSGNTDHADGSGRPRRGGDRIGKEAGFGDNNTYKAMVDAALETQRYALVTKLTIEYQGETETKEQILGRWATTAESVVKLKAALRSKNQADMSGAKETGGQDQTLLRGAVAPEHRADRRTDGILGCNRRKAALRKFTLFPSRRIN